MREEEYSIQHTAKKRPRDNNMTSPLRRLATNLAIVAATTISLPYLVIAQTTAFTREVECPDNPGLTGYVTIADMNADMKDEVERIVAGGTPQNNYDLRFCPGRLDATGGNLIQPVLDQVTISCSDGSVGVNSNCIVDGSRGQLIIEDPKDANYTLSNVKVDGLIFNGLTRGDAAFQLEASAPTFFVCKDCVFQDFVDSEYVVDLSGTMTFKLVDGVVQVRYFFGFPLSLLFFRAEREIARERERLCVYVYARVPGTAEFSHGVCRLIVPFFPLVSFASVILYRYIYSFASVILYRYIYIYITNSR